MLFTFLVKVLLSIFAAMHMMRVFPLLFLIFFHVVTAVVSMISTIPVHYGHAEGNALPYPVKLDIHVMTNNAPPHTKLRHKLNANDFSFCFISALY